MLKEEQYLSLQEATKHCVYSQEYLSLRARQGKLKALKIGRNWVTKKEWLEDYLKTFNNKNGNNVISEKSFETTAKPKEFLPLPKEKFSFPTIKQYPWIYRKFSVPFVVHRPIIIKGFLFQKKGNFLSAKIGFNLAKALFLILLISGGFFIFQTTKTNSFFKQSLANVTQNVSLIKENMDFQDIQAANISAFKEYGKWLAGSIKNLPKNIIKGYFMADQFVEKKLKAGYSALAGFLNPKKEIAQENSFSNENREILKEQPKEGMVVLPYRGEQNREAVVQKIKDSFSDEVKVEIKDESSGVIIPIFKEQKEGDKYFYVLVPLQK
jgi:hypothetical protein